MHRTYSCELKVGISSQAADTYSFGVLLWEMYTGQRPWAGMLQMQIIFNVTVQKKQLEFPSDAPEQIKVRVKLGFGVGFGFWLRVTQMRRV